MNERRNSFRGLCRRDFAVFAALPLVIGLPFVCVQYALFGPANRLLSLLTSRFNLSADALTVVMSALYLLLFSLALFAGDRFLRRFLGPLHKGAQ